MRLHREQILSCRHNENWARVSHPGVGDRHGCGDTCVHCCLICPTSHLCLTFRGNCIRAQCVMQCVNDAEALPLFLIPSLCLPLPHVLQQTPPLLLTACLIYDSNSPAQTQRRRPHSQLYVCILVSPHSPPPSLVYTSLSPSSGLSLSLSMLHSLLLTHTHLGCGDWLS